MSNFSFAEELLSKKIPLNNFLHMLQTQSSDIICLVGGKEIILYNKTDLQKGMWKKYKEDDEYGFYYLNENNQHITIYSLEADMLLGSIPAEPQQSQSNKPSKPQNLLSNSLQAPIPNMMYPQQPQNIPQQNMYQPQNYYQQQMPNSTSRRPQQVSNPYPQQQFSNPYPQQQVSNPYPQQQFSNPYPQQQQISNPYPQQYDAVQAAYYQQNQYIPFYNGMKQDKTSTSSNTKPQKVESKFMA